MAGSASAVLIDPLNVTVIEIGVLDAKYAIVRLALEPREVWRGYAVVGVVDVVDGMAAIAAVQFSSSAPGRREPFP